MPKEWPATEFQEYLRARMRAAGISSETELSELSGVGLNQFSTWRLGRNQPTIGNLRRVAHALKVEPWRLFAAAGLLEPGDLAAGEQADPFANLPEEIQQFIGLYNDRRLSEDQRRYARVTVAYITSGLRAELAKSQVKPSGRRRAG